MRSWRRERSRTRRSSRPRFTAAIPIGAGLSRRRVDRGPTFVLDRASVAVGPIKVFVEGVPHDERADQAANVLKDTNVAVTVDLGTGKGHEFTMWTCDFSAEYVRINSEYRT